jgi:DNA-binding HxlR family transcriptional regulator
MARPPARSPCPVACTLDLLGDRWTLLVVRDLFLGRQRFDEFARSPEGIASNILTDRLRRLEELGLVARTPSPSHRGRGTYALTERGRSLGPVVKAIVVWGLANIRGTKIIQHPVAAAAVAEGVTGAKAKTRPRARVER